ncbi:MAG: hypothetical protein JWR62_739 [Modestobacter sp.]|jgi:hypothetical protein|nr:hypothetical protein [Modestobacter sp.]
MTVHLAPCSFGLEPACPRGLEPAGGLPVPEAPSGGTTMSS